MPAAPVLRLRRDDCRVSLIALFGGTRQYLTSAAAGRDLTEVGQAHARYVSVTVAGLGTAILREPFIRSPRGPSMMSLAFTSVPRSPSVGDGRSSHRFETRWSPKRLSVS